MTESGTVLDTWFPSPTAGRIPGGYDPAKATENLDHLAVPDERRAVSVELVTLEIDLDAAPTGTSDAYLRLHALSHRLVAPNGLNLDGIFGHLPNVAWTNAGPMHPDDATRLRPFLAREGIQVRGWTSSRACSTTSRPRACASPTRRVCDSVPTCRPGRPSCTRAS